MIHQHSDGGRVLVSAHTYQPDGVSEGWTAAQLVAALRARGRRMVVLTAALRKARPAYGIVGIRCKTEADTPFITASNYSEFALRSLILSRGIKKKFAVIHHVSPIVLRLPSILGLLGRPFIWGPVGGSVPFPDGFSQYGGRSGLVSTLRSLDRPRMYLDPTMRMTMHCADRIVLTTSMSSRMIPDSYHEKIVVIPEGIPESLVLKVAPVEEPYIFSSGRLIDYKAMDLLIRAFARVQPCDVKLKISGDGPNRASLQELIGRLRLNDRVEMLGRIPRAQNQLLMSRSLFCAFPAVREAFGHVNLEAMAAWKPIVVTDWGGPRDLVVQESTGIKILGRDPDEHVEMFGAAMQRLIDDSALRRRMGAAAALRALNEYTWPVLAARYDALYGQVSA